MRRGWLNLLTPWGWAVAAAAGVVLFAAVAGLAGFRWDPLRLTERRLAQSRTELAAARADLSARRHEQAAEAGQRARQAEHARKTTAATTLSVAAETQARSAPDADQTLDPDRADRLGRLDDGLCRLAPDLEGCSAPAGGPGRG
ncbi:MAG: hypothetical protein KF910_09420 [Brevundimonas sp.]|uniref:hypothetical protein n=1 Tax=Brevundimonas sp. TaxID=1871086 RepID=UPI0025C3C8F8|nr:hypothetical protein [Brevundimonas sp.]MBX3477817.1 hypothetical protein [Brevundimonas sp.]